MLSKIYFTRISTLDLCFKLVCMSFLLLGFFWHCSDTSLAFAENKPIKIAVIGPMTGQDASSGQAMLDGVRLAASQVNAQGGIKGRQVEVLSFDNMYDKEAAQEQALAIAQSTDAVAVIGHY